MGSSNLAFSCSSRKLQLGSPKIISHSRVISMHVSLDGREIKLESDFHEKIYLVALRFRYAHVPANIERQNLIIISAPDWTANL